MPLNDLVDKYWDEYNLGDIPEKAWEGVTIDGQIYGVPIVGNTLHLIYRQDVFDELGIEVPETYDDVIEDVQHHRPGQSRLGHALYRSISPPVGPGKSSSSRCCAPMAATSLMLTTIATFQW